VDGASREASSNKGALVKSWITAGLFTFIASHALAGSSGSALSCATPDQTVILRLELKPAFLADASSDSIEEIQIKAGKKSVTFTDGDISRVLHFSNGETVVRDFATGKTVLTFKQVPLSRSDRGFERKIVVSQGEHFSKSATLQCRFQEVKKLRAAL
jgi:hypothetical protein